MGIFALLIASCVSAFCFKDLPIGAEVFISPNLRGTMSVQTAEYNFSFEESSSGKIIKGSLPGGAKIEHILIDAGFDKVERLFALKSNGCGSSSIDLIIQTGPSNNSDIINRSYYRIIFANDLSRIVAEFYDPSVSAVNAVLPIQAVEGIRDPDTGEKIVCNSSTPSVTK